MCPDPLKYRIKGSRRLLSLHYHCKCADENSERFLHLKRVSLSAVRFNKVCRDCAFVHGITLFLVMKVSRVRLLGTGDEWVEWDNSSRGGMTFSCLRQRCNSLCNFLRKIDPAHAKGRNTASFGGASLAFCNPGIAFKGCRMSVGAESVGVLELMTFCNHVGVNDALCNREKDTVVLIGIVEERVSDARGCNRSTA